MTDKLTWVTVYETQEVYDAMEVKNLLSEHGVPTKIAGSGSVQVPVKFAAVAKELVDARPDQDEY